jgi:V/A-type H+-transporting ATPase subunit C
MSAGYDYLNARIRGMRARLLAEEDLRAALNAPDMGAWLEILRRTPYEPFMLGAGPSTEKVALCEAVDQGTAARTTLLPRWAAGASETAVEILLAEWDLPNLAAVLAGVFRHDRPADIVAATLAGGLLSAGQMGELARARDLREAADRLATWSYPYHLAFRTALGRKGENPSLPVMRLALVRAFTALLARRAEAAGDAVLLGYVGERIDHLNLATALLAPSLPLDRSPDSFFLPGGALLTPRDFDRMLAAPDPGRAVGEAPAPYRRALLGALVAREETGRSSIFPQALERHLFFSRTRVSALDPLGPSLLLAYLLRLRREGVVLKLGLTRLTLGAPSDAFLAVVGDV